jgi:hypothetical protein
MTNEEFVQRLAKIYCGIDAEDLNFSEKKFMNMLVDMGVMEKEVFNDSGVTYTVYYSSSRRRSRTNST